MPCNHKFLEFLHLEKLDFESTTLIVGTFNPSIEENKAGWFYGRYENNFWDVLPRLYGENSMRSSSPSDWKVFCKRHKIAITDLISCIEDADHRNSEHSALLRTYSDSSITKKFKQHTTVKIDELLNANPSIKNVYMTRGISDTFWKKLWKPVEQYAKKTGINENKLLTPSGYAFYQLGRYNKRNPNHTLKLENFILEKWREKWHEI